MKEIACLSEEFDLYLLEKLNNGFVLTRLWNLGLNVIDHII